LGANTSLCYSVSVVIIFFTMSDQTESVETKQAAEQKDAPAAAPAPRGGSQPKKSSTPWIVLGVVLVVFGLALAYSQGMFGGSDGTAASGEQEPSTVVATVNGEDITRAELDEKMEQIRRTLPEGYDSSADANFEYDVLDEIINVRLLVARALASGLEVTDAEIEEEIQGLKELFGDEATFNAQLEQAQLTEEGLRTNMRNELLIRKLVDQETNIADVNVSEEELQAAYDLSIGSQGEGAPSLDEVRGVLQVELLNQKSASVITAYIDNVRSEADIEVKI
jgi:hypothetical protein